MNFQEFVNKCWNDHANNSKGVAARLAEGIGLLEKTEDLASLAHLATHVLGEHLGQWAEGRSFLKGLEPHSLCMKGSETAAALARNLAVLELCEGNEGGLPGFTESEQVRILAVSAAALSAQNQGLRAQEYFYAALEQAQLGLEKEDPANRALAVTGNNLACALEERTGRTEAETKLMILAAETGRKYWEIAGSWKEVCWAEYRLAMSYRQADRLPEALEHAQICREQAEENSAGPLETFFAFEAIALVESRRRNSSGFGIALRRAQQEFASLSIEDQKWCEPSLKKLEQQLGELSAAL